MAKAVKEVNIQSRKCVLCAQDRKPELPRAHSQAGVWERANLPKCTKKRIIR
jgi:hypothetical protein